MKTVCPIGPTIKGFDISHYEPIVNFSLAKAGGFEFCSAKASEGISVTDHSFAAHRANAKAVGMPFIAYHFLHPSQDPKVQAAHFCQVVGALQPGEAWMPDWEVTDGVNALTNFQRGIIFIKEVTRLLGVGPIAIYGGPYYFQALGNHPELAALFPWIAHYGVNCPLCPDVWKSWRFWQYSDKGRVPGVGRPGGNPCDVDVFNGTLDQLKALCVQPLQAPVKPVQSDKPAVQPPKKE